MFLRTTLGLGLALQFSAALGFDCDVRIPDSKDLPELGGWKNFEWVGSRSLAARVPNDGQWVAMGSSHNFRDKWWWWHDGYRSRQDPQPALTITAERLDEPGPPIVIERATSAYGPGWDRMLVMMEFPSPGCWAVQGSYRDEELSFVFRVDDVSPSDLSDEGLALEN